MPHQCEHVNNDTHLATLGQVTLRDMHIVKQQNHDKTNNSDLSNVNRPTKKVLFCSGSLKDKQMTCMT